MMTSSRASENADHHLGALWAAAWQNIPAPIARMLSGGGSALEVGCGWGLACLALAEAIPQATVVGHDEDPAAIARARQLARAAGLDGRVRFAVDDSRKLPRARFHLITAEALRARHPEPRRVLNAIRNALVPEGACLLIEPPGPPRAARLSTSTDMDLQTLARQAGFSRFRAIASEGPLRLHELRR